MNENEMYNVSAYLDSKFGASGTPSRIAAEERAWQEYNEQILLDARKNETRTRRNRAKKNATDFSEYEKQALKESLS